MLARGFNFFEGGVLNLCQVAPMLLDAGGKGKLFCNFFRLQMCLTLCVGLLCPSQPMFYVIRLSVVYEKWTIV